MAGTLKTFRNLQTERATDRARNEQQKSVLLCELARERCQTAREDLLEESAALLQESRKLVNRSVKNRTRKSA